MSRSNVRTLVREFAKHDARFSTTARETVDAAAHGAANARATSSAIRALAATTFAAVVSVPTAMCAPFGLGGKKESSPPSDQKFESEIKASRSNKSGANAAFDPEALERGAKALREINQSPYATKV